MENRVKQIEQQALAALGNAENSEQVKALSVKYIGRKGLVTLFLRNISKLPAEQRPEAGKQANIIKKRLETAFQKAIDQFALNQQDNADDFIDVSLPGRPAPMGSLHPITKINRRI